ncbi:hypothetical protein Tco_0992780 [Tanacetum coccineum]|uniref:Uncharacterized protein n=1 Tax=Tanacetum coccineum TaxID=301880 RepID=A0ABQ5F323_9ASTR
MATVTTMESLQKLVNELKNAILEIKEGMNGFLVSQNSISNELNRMKNGEATSNNGGNHNHRTGGRGYERMSKIEFSKFHGDDVKEQAKKVGGVIMAFPSLQESHNLAKREEKSCNEAK